MTGVATVALRIDVDTHRGLVEGVPRLLDVFRALGIRASFFVTMGPDRSGAAWRRAWRPSFLAKMWRTNPFRLYGVRTLLSGTVLRPKPVGAGHGELLRQIAAEGHEVAPHGFDHVRWQDSVHRMSAHDVRRDLHAAARAFEDVFGTRPEASAAPGWRITEAALLVQEECGYRYASDARGFAPFRPAVQGGSAKTIQIPTTMPTVDELLGRVRAVERALLNAVRPGLNVLTAHAEVEGGAWLGPFERFVREAARRTVRIERLDDAVAALGEPVPAGYVRRGRIPGRSGWVAVQTDVSSDS